MCAQSDRISSVAEHVVTYHGGSVRVAEAVGKGRILLASRDFEPGERILLEYPLVEVAVDRTAPAYQLLGKLREDGCLDAAPTLFYWAALCSLTCTEAANARCPAWPTISRQTQLQVLQLHAPSEACRAASPSTLTVAAEFWLPGMGADPVQLEALLQRWIYNSFDQGGSDDLLEAGGLYVAASMLSHSCAPNAAWHLDDANSFILHARAQIDEGEEITIPYLSVADLCLPTPDRREILRASKDFTCCCVRCIAALDDARTFSCPLCGGRAAAVMVPQEDSAAAGLSADAVACNTCGTLDVRDSARLLAAEADLSLWVRSRQPVGHARHTEVSPIHCGATALELAQRATAAGLAGTHWALDIARAAAAEEAPAEACNLLRLRVFAHEAVGSHALARYARLCLALGRLLSGKGADAEALQEAIDMYARASQGLAMLFGDDDPEHREAERLGNVAARLLAAGSKEGHRATSALSTRYERRRK